MKEHADNYFTSLGHVDWETDLSLVLDGECCLIRYIYETPIEKINKIAFALKKYGLWHVADHNFYMEDEKNSVGILADYSQIKDSHVIGFVIFYKRDKEKE